MLCSPDAAKRNPGLALRARSGLCLLGAGAERLVTELGWALAGTDYGGKRKGRGDYRLRAAIKLSRELPFIVVTPSARTTHSQCRNVAIERALKLRHD